MTKAIVPKPTSLEKRAARGGAGNLWLWVGLFAAVAIAANAKDIIRYIRISNM